MKKVVAVVLIIFMVLMGGMFVWGFIDGENKENTVEEKVEQVAPEQPVEEATTVKEKQISSTELAKHNKSNDCWVVIRGSVYDVTSYLDEHPGGADLILNYCGEDATTAYNTKGGEGRHSTKADALLADFKLGQLN